MGDDPVKLKLREYGVPVARETRLERLPPLAAREVGIGRRPHGVLGDQECDPTRQPGLNEALGAYSLSAGYESCAAHDYSLAIGYRGSTVGLEPGDLRFSLSPTCELLFRADGTVHFNGRQLGEDRAILAALHEWASAVHARIVPGWEPPGNR